MIIDGTIFRRDRAAFVARKPPRPPPAHIDALKAFKKHHGKQWRTRLGQYWRDGWGRDTEGLPYDVALLQELRNTHGPTWLANQKEIV